MGRGSGGADTKGSLRVTTPRLLSSSWELSVEWIDPRRSQLPLLCIWRRAVGGKWRCGGGGSGGEGRLLLETVRYLRG